MATLVRDAIVSFLEKNEGKYFTVGELANQASLNKLSAGHALARLKALGIAARQVREGQGSPFEYSAGKRMNFAKKYAGRKFPYHQNRGDAPPASVKGNGSEAPPPPAESSLGLILKVDGQAHAITLSQAKAIYLELKQLFG